MSDTARVNESKVEMAIWTVLILVYVLCFGHFILYSVTVIVVVGWKVGNPGSPQSDRQSGTGVRASIRHHWDMIEVSGVVLPLLSCRTIRWVLFVFIHFLIQILLLFIHILPRRKERSLTIRSRTIRSGHWTISNSVLDKKKKENKSTQLNHGITLYCITLILD